MSSPIINSFSARRETKKTTTVTVDSVAGCSSDGFLTASFVRTGNSTAYTASSKSPPPPPPPPPPTPTDHVTFWWSVSGAAECNIFTDDGRMYGTFTPEAGKCEIYELATTIKQATLQALSADGAEAKKVCQITT